jgi:hypothetical protein
MHPTGSWPQTAFSSASGNHGRNSLTKMKENTINQGFKFQFDCSDERSDYQPGEPVESPVR